MFVPCIPFVKGYYSCIWSALWYISSSFPLHFRVTFERFYDPEWARIIGGELREQSAVRTGILLERCKNVDEFLNFNPACSGQIPADSE